LFRSAGYRQTQRTCNGSRESVPIIYSESYIQAECFLTGYKKHPLTSTMKSAGCAFAGK
jgi:hypothetical protein